jgi:hypothetical protein
MATFCNIWVFDKSSADLPPREATELVIATNGLNRIVNTLISSGYRQGDVGWVTVRSLMSQPPGPRDEIYRTWTASALIPFVVVRDPAELRFVVGFFPSGEEVPADFLQKFEKKLSADGSLVLFERRASN